MEDFKKILKEISENLNNVKYEYGDYSDIGNEIPCFKPVIKSSNCSSVIVLPNTNPISLPMSE